MASLWSLVRHRPLAALAVTIAFAASTACSDGDAVGFPELRISPDTVVFPGIRLGDEGIQEVTLVNPGGAALTIRNIKLSDGSTGGDEFELLVRDADGKLVEVPDRFEIEGDEKETVTLAVRYTPKDDRADNATISFETNARDASDVEIPVRSDRAVAQIAINPRSLDFGRVAAEDKSCGTVTVTNVGTIALDIRNIIVGGSLDFTPLVDGKDPRRDAEVYADPDGDGEPGLGSGNSFDVEVCYEPPSEGPDFGELTILSSDTNRPEFNVNLIANGSTPCINIVPATVEFPTSLVLREDSRSVTVESCGSEALEIRSIRVDGDDEFSVDQGHIAEAFGSDLPAHLPAVTEGAARPNRTFRVNFEPEEERIFNGKILIETNDPFMPIREVSLLGRGVINACPEPRVAQSEFFVLPLDKITLDGSPSIDSDGPANRPVEYRWTVTSRPDGSGSQPLESFVDLVDPSSGGPEDDPTTPNAVFWADLAGTYTLELQVTDNLGLSSETCGRAALVQIVAVPDDDVHVQLIWRTPADEDETDDDGTDLDLHMLRPGVGEFRNRWFSLDDVWFENFGPDWGTAQDPTDDPVIDIDDINGAGPENTNLNLPERTADRDFGYVVGVHYYCQIGRRSSTDYGHSNANVRIFLDGTPAWDYAAANEGPRELELEGDMWEVAEIDWANKTVNMIDRVFQSEVWCGHRPDPSDEDK